MCLLGLTHVDEAPTEGFKIFVETDAGLVSPIMGDQLYTLGRTYHDSNKNEIDCSITNESYEAGYHFCDTLSAAKLKLGEYATFNEWDTFVIAKVKMANIVATGYETVRTGLFSSIQIEVFVAKTMTLEKIVYDFKIRNRIKRWWHSKFSSKE